MIAASQDGARGDGRLDKHLAERRMRREKERERGEVGPSDSEDDDRCSSGSRDCVDVILSR